MLCHMLRDVLTNTCLSNIHSGIAAATMFTLERMAEVSETQLRVAFDGDAVLFSDESERIFKAHGLQKFFEHEKTHENKPLDHVQYKQCSRSQYHTALIALIASLYFSYCLCYSGSNHIDRVIYKIRNSKNLPQPIAAHGVRKHLLIIRSS